MESSAAGGARRTLVSGSRRCGAGSAGTRNRDRARATPNGRAGCGWFQYPTAPAAVACKSLLPPLAIGSQVELVRPAVARLVVQRPIGFGDGAGLDQAVRRQIGHRAGGAESSVNRLAVDRAIDDQVSDVDILRCELARRGLRDPAQAELSRRKSGIAGTAAQAGGGAGEQDGAAAAR